MVLPRAHLRRSAAACRVASDASGSALDAPPSACACRCSRQLHTRAPQKALGTAIKRAFEHFGGNSLLQGKVRSNGDKMHKHRIVSTPCVASLLLALTAWTGCEEQASPSASTPTTVANDSAAAYAALSTALSQCDDNFDTCSESAGTSMSARAQCASERDACNKAAAAMEADAENKLERETHHCRAVCSDDDAGPGDDSADAGSGDMNECLGHHAPRLPHCLGGLFSCLVDAGVFHRDASRGEIRDCVREANSCIVDELRELRERGRHHHEAGSSAAGSGGSGGSAGAATAGSGGASAGDADSDDQDDENDEGGRGRGRRHRGFFGWWRF